MEQALVLPMSVHAPTETQHEHHQPQSNARTKSAQNDTSTSQNDAQHKPNKRPHLQRPKNKMMARTIAELLEEPKIHLLHRVVKIAGPDIAWQSLMETMRVEANGGMPVNAEACGMAKHMLQVDQATRQVQPRRRTKGGVFLSMLKARVSKEVYKDIFAIEENIKKQRKQMCRRVRAQQMEAKVNGLPIQELHITNRSACSSASTGGVDEDQEDGEVEDAVMQED